MTLTRPTIGTKTNWGSVINNNFKQIEDQFHIVEGEVRSIYDTISSKIPYIKIDPNRLFITISQLEENKQIIYKFSYSSEPAGPIRDEYKYNYNKSEWETNPPLYVGSYVVNSINTNIGSFSKGDFIVSVQQSGGISSLSSTIISYVHFVPLSEYYIPTLNQDNPYELVFTKADYVDWFTKEDKLSFTLPSLGYSVFNSFGLAKTARRLVFTINERESGDFKNESGIVTYSCSFASAGNQPEDFNINTTWLLETAENQLINAPLLWNESLIIKEGDNITVTFIFDTNSLQVNERLLCKWSVSHKEI